jgi:glycosyltransferase involved in cell wall biosynthesis
VRVAFLTQDLQLSGGVGVVVEHAAQLARRHGFDVSLVLTREQGEPDWAFRGLEQLHVLPLHRAVGERFDVAVSTWWETAEHLFELDAARYASFVQSLEERFYAPGAPERMAAALALDLPVRHLTEARWIARALEGLRPGTRTLLVRNGIAKDVFAAPRELEPRRAGPLRIVVEGDPAVWFKGVGEALAATSAMREPRHVTAVSAARDGLDGADEVVGPLSAREMAALYGRSDVVLKLSRVEGMFGPPLEGFHRGATCVVTPVTGHDEYVRHRVNGLVVGFDDRPGTTDALDLLARDRRLLQELRCGALATARGWPSWEQAGAFMALALRRIAAEPPPPARATGLRLARDLQTNLAVAQRATLDHEVTATLLAEIRSQRVYRWGIVARRVFRGALAPLRWLRSRRGG